MHLNNKIDWAKQLAFFACALAGASLMATQGSSTAEPSSAVVVHWDKPRQVLEGFGASLAWHEADLYRFERAAREQLLSFAFDPSQGMGLSLLRTRINPKFMASPGDAYDWEAPEVQESGRLLRLIQDRYDPLLMASAWTPPKWMKSNQSHKNGGHLLRENYEAYAAYLVDWVVGMRREFGVEIDVLSPQNEPDERKRWESCVWKPEALAVFVKDYLAPELKRQQVVVKILAPEPTDWDLDYVNRFLSEPQLAEHLDLVGAHLYKRSFRNPVPLQKARSLGLPVWQTEFYLGDYRYPASQRDNIDEHDRMLKTTRIMHDFLTHAEVSVYNHWWLLAIEAKASESLLYSKHDLDARPNLDQMTHWQSQPVAWGFLHFSRYLRPGAQRVEVHPSSIGQSCVVSAFSQAGTKTLVIINSAESSQALALSVGPVAAQTLKIVTSTSGDYLNTQAVVPTVDQESLKLSAPARSILTLQWTAP
jgi:glucuronoarabinoxylan endo-1,4-beta-xylanase